MTMPILIVMLGLVNYVLALRNFYLLGRYADIPRFWVAYFFVHASFTVPLLAFGVVRVLQQSGVLSA